MPNTEPTPCPCCHNTGKCDYVPSDGPFWDPVDHTPGGKYPCLECDARHLPKCWGCGAPAEHSVDGEDYCDMCAIGLVTMAMRKVGMLPRINDTIPCEERIEEAGL